MSNDVLAVLFSRVYMRKSYKTTCPSCGKDTLYVTPYNGMSYCFRASCHYMSKDGNSIDERKLIRSDNIAEIRELYRQVTWYYHSSLDNTARSYLHKRGFSDQTIQDLMIGYAPEGKLPLYRNPIAIEAGLAGTEGNAFLGGRITFPYFKRKDVVTDIRARSIDPNEELKYKSPFGSAYYRGAIYPYNYHLAKDAQRIILTEAEIKADIAVQIGYPTIAIPGISAWRKGFIQEDNQEIIIVFDTERDPSVRYDVITAIRKIATYIDNAYVATLPLESNEQKAEIDTFVNKHGPELFKSIVDNAIPFETWNQLQ